MRDTRLKSLLASAKAATHPHFTILAGLALVSMVSLIACSSAADRSDNIVGRTPILSPQACAEHAALQKAASSFGDTPTSSANNGYFIQPGDELNVSFYLSPEFNQDVVVRPDGRVSMKLVGVVQAAGLTPSQLANSLDKDYLSELRSPGVTVSVKSMPSRQIYVQGQVSKPGAFPLEPGMTALQAVADAGGLTEDAGDDAILIRRDACGVPYGSKVDLQEAIKSPSGEQDAILQPRDILVVPRSGIANMDLFVKHYIRNLMPITPYAPLPM